MLYCCCVRCVAGSFVISASRCLRVRCPHSCCSSFLPAWRRMSAGQKRFTRLCGDRVVGTRLVSPVSLPLSLCSHCFSTGSSAVSLSCLPVSSRSQRLDAFWSALCDGAENKVSKLCIDGEDADGAHWLSLIDAHWFGEPILGSHLYVRRCWRQLYEQVQTLWDQDLWVLLLGSPGIGKSMFRAFLIYCLCHRHADQGQPFTIMLSTTTDASTGTCERFTFNPAAANKYTTCHVRTFHIPEEWRQQPGNPGAHNYWIVDGASPDVHRLSSKHVRLLMLSTPMERRFHSYTKEAARWVVTLWMPPVSLREIIHMAGLDERRPDETSDAAAAAASSAASSSSSAVKPRITIRDGLGLNDVQSRYAMLGGSVRAVLQFSPQIAFRLISDAIVAAASLDDLLWLSAFGEVDAVHFRVNEEEEARQPLFQIATAELADPPLEPRVAAPLPNPR